MRRHSSLASFAVCVMIAAVPSTARADAASDAKDLFTRGREMRAAGDCAGAVGVFRKAYELYPAGLGSLRNVAECEEGLGHFASSRRAWIDLKRALLTERDPKYDGWAKDAADAAGRLTPKLSTLTIDVQAESPIGTTLAPTGVRVTLDGETLAPALLGTPLERDPGHHVVKVAGDGVKAQPDRVVDLVAGDSRRIALRVVLAPPATTAGGTAPAAMPATSAPADDHPDDATEQSRANRRTWGWIAVGVGAASAVGAAISIGVRQSALNDVQGGCPSLLNCPSSYQSTVSQGQTASVAATVFFIGAVLGLGGGAALVLTSKPPAQGQARLVVTPTLGGATAAWSF